MIPSAPTFDVQAFAARLHSRYQPQLEAERYIEALNLSSDVDFVILIEPGLGYLIPALHKIHPGCKAVVLHTDKRLGELRRYSTDVPAWFPDCGCSVQEFLENAIPDTASMQIIEWRPSVSVFGEACLELTRECSAFIKRAAASRRTLAMFGRRWLRNFFRNLRLINSAVLYKTMDRPIVITGSGPSLETVLPQIQSCREGIFLIAASSSLPALISGGIRPDLLISTDGGGWALLHLHACFRSPLVSPGAFSQPPLFAAALAAALPSQCTAFPLLAISDGSLWQNMALHAAAIPSVLIPQRGTVTASALELALLLTRGNIFLAGMDLALSDIKSHARPNGFDHLFSRRACRLLPEYSQYFMRSSDMRLGGSHEVYAAWFKSRGSWPGRIFALGGKHAIFASNEPQVSNLLAGAAANDAGNFKAIVLDGSAHERCRRAVDTLIGALHTAPYAEDLSRELGPLLFPSHKEVSAAAIAKALEEAARG